MGIYLSSKLLRNEEYYEKTSELYRDCERNRDTDGSGGSHCGCSVFLFGAKPCVSQRKDYLHKESRKITNFYDLVCIESLNMKEMSQDSRFGTSVHDNGWGMFTDFLSYKLERAGKKLVRIDKWYPSSKICSCCGKLKKELKLEDRIYSCTCGNQMNRDENAAINICREGLRISGVELDTERKIS